MNRLLVLATFILLSPAAFSQSNLYLEAFGATGFGLSANYEKQFKLSENSKIGIPLGLGLRYENKQSPTFWLYKSGLSYYYKTWGLGLDASFHQSIGDETSTTSFTETQTILYPNLNYTWHFSNNWFLKPSVGMAFSYVKVINPEFDPQFSRRRFWQSSSVYFGLALGTSF